MKMFKTHHKKMLLRGVADLQRMVEELRLKNASLVEALQWAERDMDNAERMMHDLQLEIRKLQLQLKIKTESEKRMRKVH